MRSFINGQRIQVKSATGLCPTSAQYLMAGKTGTVVRLLNRDNSAWVKMDEAQTEQLRAFPADDESGRGNNILLYPEECKAVKA